MNAFTKLSIGSLIVCHLAFGFGLVFKVRLPSHRPSLTELTAKCQYQGLLQVFCRWPHSMTHQESWSLMELLVKEIHQ